ncbi:OsmC family protein [Engelhardtia mirabilis]|uniref:OsmC-like protein n=1 Tax=Engelhardtia mirabilis TaxID=2528011 RepID=A0A518BJU1_9BACT|nr:OsmC-like protein [Planctomycetes bacterium Pla133]QDV01562.1 OsmC-like protein [Planctomycetes bacterium Pla86]
MVEIHVTYRGELRCGAVHAPSSAELVTDAPVDNQGRGESYSPTDLVATALGSCMLTIMGIRARDEGWDLDGATVKVTKHMVADPRRRISKLEVRFALPNLADEARDVLERAAETCPVFESIHPNIEVPVHFGWAELVR